ncbi:unnamed protein product [Cuscuta epithymum]|uniref:Uncharacterized protein n=1 Tax=Cuscuta epithymum TaxID=186058 RepID=A0AAV0EYD7_9ASTE|nr:unnamed protein product [Cuscuta epithymum]
MECVVIMFQSKANLNELNFLTFVFLPSLGLRLGCCFPSPNILLGPNIPYWSILMARKKGGFDKDAEVSTVVPTPDSNPDEIILTSEIDLTCFLRKTGKDEISNSK